MPWARPCAGGSTAPGRRDDGALAEAEECFPGPSNLYRALGMRSATSALAPYWAILIEFARGRAADAMDRLEKALTLVSDLPRRWAYVMCFRAWVAAELGPGRGLPGQRARGLPGGRPARQQPVPRPRALETGHPGLLPRGRRGHVHHLRQVELHQGHLVGASLGRLPG